jgi:hypothetical protein
MNCSKCGAPLNGASFCAACGTPAGTNDVSVPVTPVQPTFASPQPTQSPQAPFTEVPKTNGLAIAGFVTSLTCLGPVAVALSIVALNQINKSPTPQGGKGLAIAGIVIGGIYFIATAYLWTGFFIF